LKLLLDTHIMLWWALGDEQLTEKGRILISDDSNMCAVSVASVWEVAIKSSLGRGLPPGINAVRFADLIVEAGFVLCDVKKKHALAVEQLEGHHGDPFDKLLVAHAQVESWTLLTHDSKLAAYGDVVRLV
jgi:PIN domain nuclease of toxin-antitoxin system